MIYCSIYEDNVYIINTLKSGVISSFNASQIDQVASSNLQEVPGTLRAAIGVEVSVDLEAITQGLEYSSFAEAVDSYNTDNCTNYIKAEAR